MRHIRLQPLPCSCLALVLNCTGCNTSPPPPPAPPAALVVTTQPVGLVANLSTLSISRGELDELMYKAYGIRFLFDIVELDLAKATLKQQGLTLTSDDIENERRSIIKGICGPKAEPSDYDNLFKQFLQNQHITEPEFDVKIVQTNAALRKLVTPLVVNKLPEFAIHRGFEQMYGAKRRIADIVLNNVREAAEAKARLKTVPFDVVARSMSIDEQTRQMGGEWEQPFSMQSPWAAQTIRDQAFSLNKGDVSDILQADGKYHIIKVLECIDPKVVKFNDVKEEVKKQLEDSLIEANMKKLREELQVKTQQQIQLIDPVLKAEWNKLVEAATSNTDRESARSKIAEQTHAATAPSTAPTTQK